MGQGLIDVHHHIIPKVYKRGLEEAGITHSGGLRIGDWEPEDSLKFMDELGIATGYCSISEPALYPLVRVNPEQARMIARKTNECMAELKAKHPGRFGGFALLPMPDVDGAIEEMIYALDVLKLDGIGLLSNYENAYLGNRCFTELFSEAQKRGAVVYIHPSVPPAPSIMPRPEYLPLDFFAEFCFHTTRAALNLILSGTLERCPDIRPILSHMGGAMPYLVWRVEACTPKQPVPPERRGLPSYVYDGWESLKKPVSAYAAQFYFDTALATHQTAFEAVENLAPGHTLFGSDSFYATKQLEEVFIQSIRTYFTDETRRYDVMRGNAERLFNARAEIRA